MSWKASSVKRQPLWQATQPALPTKSAKPERSSASRAAASPSSQRSKRVFGETRVRSKLASAARMWSSVTRGSSGNAAAKRAVMAGSAARRAAALAMSPPISRRFSIGPLACASRLGARPSQKKVRPQARFHSDGVRRGRGSPSWPSLRATPSEKDRAGSWQVAQAMVPSPDSRVSVNSARPRSTFCGVTGLPGGAGIAAGRAKASRNAASASSAAARRASAPADSTAATVRRARTKSGFKALARRFGWTLFILMAGTQPSSC